MSSARGEESAHDLGQLIAEIRTKGVTLWTESGRLRYRAPKGALGEQDLRVLRTLSGRIVDYLAASGDDGTVPPLGRRGSVERIPLSYSQFKYWHNERLGERSTIRTITSATRIRGRLQSDILRRVLVNLVQRHEPLRTHIVRVGGVPTQAIAASTAFDLQVRDLRSLPEAARAAELERLIHALVLAPINISVDPLFAAGLALLHDDEAVLVLVMEHVISDAYSMNVLLRDLFASYAAMACGQAPDLPPLPLQLADYAVWQAKAEKHWLKRHGQYWQHRLAGCERLRLPEDVRSPTPRSTGWGTVAVRIAPDLRAELVEWCRLRRTTLVLTVFAAYVGSVLRWYRVSDAVIRYQTDGRFSPLLEGTVGYFAAVLNLRVAMQAGDTFADLLNRVTDEYCRAYEHADLSYLDAQVPPPAFNANPSFNWVPQLPAQVAAQALLASSGLEISPVAVSYPVPDHYERDAEPMLLLYDRGELIDGTMIFPRSRFSPEVIEHFVSRFGAVLAELPREEALQPIERLLAAAS